MIVHMFGNAHIRPMGPWRLASGLDEAIESLRAAVERCDEYPEYRFCCGSAWVYEVVERMQADLFKRIRKLIKRGQWHVDGGLYSLPDPDWAGPISWERQVRTGQQYFGEKFRQHPKVFFDPEARGYPAWLPDFLTLNRYQGLFLYDPDWDAGLPSPVFRWKGPSGRELLCCRVTSYPQTRSDDLYGQIMEAVEGGSLMLGHVPCFFGLGGHGGGPGKGAIEYVLEHRDAFRDVLLRFSGPQDFLGEAHMMSDSFPVWEGPVGTRRPVARGVGWGAIQARHAEVETLLGQASAWLQEAGGEGIQDDLAARFDRAWKDLMLVQAAGHRDRATEEASALLSRASLAAREVIHTCARLKVGRTLEPSVHQQLVACPPFGGEGIKGPLWVEAQPNLDGDSWGSRLLVNDVGSAIPVQMVGGDKVGANLLMKATDFPKGRFVGWVRHRSGLDAPPALESPSLGLEADASQLANGIVRVTLGDGCVSGLNWVGGNSWKPVSLAGIALARKLDLDGEPPKGAKWTKWKVCEAGPLRISVQCSMRIRDSHLVWRLSLFEGDPVLRMRVCVDWNEAEALDLVVDGIDKTGWVGLGQGRGSIALESGMEGVSGMDWLCGGMSDRGWAVTSPGLNRVSRDGSAIRARVADGIVGAGGHADLEEAVSGAWHKLSYHWMPWGEGESLWAGERARMAAYPVLFDWSEGMQRPSWRNRPPECLWTENEKRSIRDGRMQHLVEGAPEVCDREIKTSPGQLSPHGPGRKQQKG